MQPFWRPCAPYRLTSVRCYFFAGTNRGPQSIVDAFKGIGRVWEKKAFEVRDVIANEHSVAMFGSFTYKTHTLGKEITSPFALLGS